MDRRKPSKYKCNTFFCLCPHFSQVELKDLKLAHKNLFLSKFEQKLVKIYVSKQSRPTSLLPKNNQSICVEYQDAHHTAGLVHSII